MGLFNKNNVYEYMDKNNFEVSLLSKLYISLLVISKYFGIIYDNKYIKNTIDLKPFNKWYSNNKNLYNHESFVYSVVISENLIIDLKKVISLNVQYTADIPEKLANIEITLDNNELLSLGTYLKNLKIFLNYLSEIIPFENYNTESNYEVKDGKTIAVKPEYFGTNKERDIYLVLNQNVNHLSIFLKDIIQFNINK